MSNTIIPFDKVKNSDLIIDAIYEGGNTGNVSDEVIGKITNTGNSGGFRLRLNKNRTPAYLVLYTSGEDINWPDEINKETGTVTYFGDNRTAGTELKNTKKKGNQQLEYIWGLDETNNWTHLPIFMFKKSPTLNSTRSVQFIGLLVPHIIGESSEALLTAIWRTDDNGNRFQNYEARFSILNTGEEIIHHEWLDALINSPADSDKFAPKVWLKYKKKNAITKKMVLEAPNEIYVRSKESQISFDSKTEEKMMEIIIDHFSDDPYRFESLAVELVSTMDNNFHFEKTRKVRDGGRDAIGYYSIGINSNKVNLPCILEAKCYKTTNSVGVKETSRFISRLKYDEFGVFITTSFLGAQAYKEIVEDKKRILILTATDIIKILKKSYITSEKKLLSYLTNF
ncbi:restriction endonuclease [Staphylococcus simulans]|nr:restriction endonuclease [Staphylococcus simulans]AVO01065.1 hypothetical protein BI282_01055 [Staphylococcus simulans]AVO04016.1 hypothetical protein BI283_01055 [Staphylococcus simulans]AWG17612.1 hypothetical protein A9958_01060 [Staphylococcus simulans]AWI00580.1 hypothetical protein A7X73_01055 [Staphylococcus simulans]MCE5024150.1 restriction endonuclease [Staphylococcus simulans]